MTQVAINLRHLRALCEVVATGSISSASRAVHLSQPAVTQAIAKLETSLDARLFVRRRTGMAASASGLILAGRAQRAFDLLRAGALKAQGLTPRARSNGFSTFDRLITWTQLKALLAVSEARNFSLAARRAGVSQPSLHKAARDLERLSGIDLFTRRPQGIALTPAAELLARHARLAEVEIRQALEELDAARGIDRALISIGTLPLARTSILPRTLNTFAAVHPATRFNVVDGPYDDLLHNLRYGEIDILIGALRDPVPIDDVVQTPLFTDTLAVAARRGHPLARVRRPTIRQLAGYPWVVPKQGPPTRTCFDELFAKAGMAAPPGLIEASSLVLIRGLLMDSDRLTLISRQQVSVEVDNGLLTCLSFALEQKARPIGITVRRDWRPTARQSAFIEHLRMTSGRLCRT